MAIPSFFLFVCFINSLKKNTLKSLFQLDGYTNVRRKTKIRRPLVESITITAILNLQKLHSNKSFNIHTSTFSLFFLISSHTVLIAEAEQKSGTNKLAQATPPTSASHMFP